VFGAGDVTVVANQDGLRLYVGHTEVGYVRSLHLAASDGGRPSMEVVFPVSHDQETARAIEEAVRLVKTMPWIRVSQ